MPIFEKGIEEWDLRLSIKFFFSKLSLTPVPQTSKLSSLHHYEAHSQVLIRFSGLHWLQIFVRVGSLHEMKWALVWLCCPAVKSCSKPFSRSLILFRDHFQNPFNLSQEVFWNHFIPPQSRLFIGTIFFSLPPNPKKTEIWLAKIGTLYRLLVFYFQAQSATLTIAQAFNLAFELWQTSQERKRRRRQMKTSCAQMSPSCCRPSCCTVVNCPVEVEHSGIVQDGKCNPSNSIVTCSSSTSCCSASTCCYSRPTVVVQGLKDPPLPVPEQGSSPTNRQQVPNKPSVSNSSSSSSGTCSISRWRFLN